MTAKKAAAPRTRAKVTKLPTRQPSEFLKSLVQQELPMEPFDRKGKLPVFYYDNTSMTAVFTASTRKVRELLPDARMHPLELLPGRCVVSFSAFEYRDTDIDPYNEFSIAFLISYDRRPLPTAGLLRGMLNRSFEAYVWKLPVTTEIARWGGVELYGYPKFLADIDFTRTPDSLECSLAENGRQVLTLTGQALKTAPAKRLRYRAYSLKDGLPLCANVYTNPLEYAQSMASGAARLELGDHPIADQLRALDLSAHPVMYQYSPKNELVLFGPRNLIDD